MGFITGKLTEEGYESSFLERLLRPKISGNTVNGLGEDKPRQASKIYHFVGQTMRFPHFWVNLIFVFKTRLTRAYWPVLKRAIENETPAHKIEPITAEPVERTPEEWTKQIKAFALENGADVVGITKTNKLWLWEGFESPGEWLIIMGFVMDYEELKKVPEIEGTSEVMRVYGNGGETASKLATWIRDQGHQARGGALIPSSLVIIPAAIEAGLGELGKHGSLINRELGSTLRLGYVAVDIPLVADKPTTFHLDDFCTSCQVCAKKCPPKAMYSEKQLVRGEKRWYVDFDKCVPYFNDNLGCGICLAVCPWSLPGRSPIMAEKLQRRRDRKKTKQDDTVAH